jgi:uncharacterized protein (TIGR02145 family)
MGCSSLETREEPLLPGSTWKNPSFDSSSSEAESSSSEEVPYSSDESSSSSELGSSSDLSSSSNLGSSSSSSSSNVIQSSSSGVSSSSSEQSSNSDLSSSSNLSSSSSECVSIKGSFIDERDSITYNTVKIGDQTWMAENLNYNAESSVCYNDDDDKCEIYGRLYDWETAKSACHDGWYLPSNDEWNELMTLVGGISTAGMHLKATNGWNNNGKNGEDTYGFAALPGGIGNSDGTTFDHIGISGSWWTDSESSPNFIYNWNMIYNSENANLLSSIKDYLRSVRCVK